MNTDNEEEKAINTMFSVYKRQLDICEHIRKDKGMGSRSEVVRAALTFYHDKLYPDYIFHLSPTAKKKKRELDKEEEAARAMASLSPEDFCANNKISVKKDQEGNSFAIFFKGANFLGALPLQEVKDYFQKDPEALLLHLSDLERWGSVDNGLATVGSEIVQKFNLVL